MSDVIVDLQAFIPALTPRFMAPAHLRPVTDLAERISRGEEVYACVSVPPRHGKTETIEHMFAWLLLQRPDMQLAYASYAARLAEKKSRRTRELARLAGVPLSADAKSRADWRTGVGDGGMWATSVGGPITGEGFDLVVIDDPTRGRAAAESGTDRERLWDWLISDVMTRLEPHASIILVQARWHPEDLLGRALGLGWQHVNLKAIDDDGAPLWPERWSLEHLHRLRETLGGENSIEWLSLYCGTPRARGSRVFRDVVFYDELPANLMVGAGLDFAYSVKSTADWSVAVLLGRSDDRYYVLDVIRVREEPKDFRDRVKTLWEGKKPSLGAFVSGTEAGVIAFFKDAGLNVQTFPANADKLTRALGAAAAWNTSKILLPRSAPWLDAFVSEVCGFTGLKDRHDDQVDALAGAVNLLHKSRYTYGMFNDGDDAQVFARANPFTV